MKNLGKRRVLLNHSDQSRWTYRNVWQRESYHLRVGRKWVPLCRLYFDTRTGRQRLSNDFMCEQRV